MLSDDEKNYLLKVIQLIEKPENYIQSWWAKNGADQSTTWHDPEAIKFDIIGAIERVGLEHPEIKESIYSEIDRYLEDRFTHVYYFQQVANHAQIISFLQAILDQMEYWPSTQELKNEVNVSIKATSGKMVVQPTINPSTSSSSPPPFRSTVQSFKSATQPVTSTNSSIELPAKKRRGRPKGSKNRPK